MSRYCSERVFALKVVAFAAAVPLLMRLPLDRMTRWIEPSDSSGPHPTAHDVFALVASIDRSMSSARPFVRSTCVVRGVTRYRFLRCAGADVSLRFGIGLIDNAMAAHCWIVYRGEPLAERRDPRGVFTEMWAMKS